jgi:hypothetical protein
MGKEEPPQRDRRGRGFLGHCDSESATTAWQSGEGDKLDAMSATVDYDDGDTPTGAAAGAAEKGAPASPAAARVGYNVLVVNPEKHGTGVAAYLTYEVRTSMTGGAFGAREFAVRRRYADFVWLRNTLAGNYLHALIPVLSEKEKLPAARAQGAKHEARVMQARCQQLQTFLHQVCLHPSISQSKDLLAFLEAKVFALDTGLPE